MTDKDRKTINAGLSAETLIAQALGRIDPETQALVPPLYPSTTFQRDADGGYSSGRGYTRPHNPTYDVPKDLLTELEGGSECLLFASGMAAATAVFQSLLPGDHVVAPRVMYWTLRKWLVDFAVSWGLEVEFIDTSDLTALAAAMRLGQTRLVWIETPANPTWDITDIAAAARIAHGARAKLAVDSTVATPILTRPIALGADLVIHSASKYLNGHADVLAGAIVTKEQDGFWQRLRAWHRDGGAVLGPFEAWLLLRGMRTLFVRVQRSSESALAIARHFEGHPRVSHVLYPGLPDHPGHAIAASQMSDGFSGMLSLRIRGGEAAAMAVAAGVRVITRATSLGGVESLIEHRASIEGPSTPVPADLLRLSIGLENSQDLISDLEQALDTATASLGAASPSVQTALAPNQSPPSVPVTDTAESRLQDLLDRRVRPIVKERGGDITFVTLTDGVLELGITGSPGASIPVGDAIRNTVRHYFPEISEVRFVALAANAGPDADRDAAPADALQRVLDDWINPAVADHGGRIELVKVEDETAYLRFEGGCQGCAMADVTLRQGVEVMIKDRVPEIVAVVDVTDHAAGRAPYFKTKKS